jgi:DNA uptake protein ComE-like DNA-binding protein
MKERKATINLQKRRGLPINFNEGDTSPLRRKSIFNRHKDFIELVEIMPDDDFYKRTKELKKENEEMTKALKTIIEISNKKIQRYEDSFKDNNYREKIETSKRTLTNSFNTLTKLNPKMKNKSFISFCPFKKEFINLNTGDVCDLKTIKEYKSKDNKNKNKVPYKPILTDVNKSHKNHIRYNPFYTKYL